jgi:hypothetical protein
MNRRIEFGRFGRRGGALLAASAALLLAACGGGGGDSPRCPSGFTAAGEPTQGYNLAVCLVAPGIAQAFDILNYPASITASGDDYSVSVATPGFTMPSPVLANEVPPGVPQTLGSYGVRLSWKEIIDADSVHEYFVYSFAQPPQDPTTPNPAATVLPMEYADYGTWELATARFATPDVIGLYSGGWILPADPKPAPAAGATYRGLVFLSYVHRDTATYASQELAGVTFAAGQLTGTMNAISYATPVPVSLGSLSFRSVTIGPGGEVMGTIDNGPAVPSVVGRFEGQFTGPDGEEFVARVALYTPATTIKVRVVGVMALKKVVVP